MDTLAQPLDQMSFSGLYLAYKAAVIRYSGTWSKKRYDTYKAQLDKFIQEKKLKPSTEAVGRDTTRFSDLLPPP